MAVAPGPVLEWRPNSIFTGPARFPDLTHALLVTEIYVPFGEVTEARLRPQPRTVA